MRDDIFEIIFVSLWKHRQATPIGGICEFQGQVHREKANRERDFWPDTSKIFLNCAAIMAAGLNCV